MFPVSQHSGFMFHATILTGIDFMLNSKIMMLEDNNINIIISLSSLISEK